MTTQAPQVTPHAGIAWEGSLALRWKRDSPTTIRYQAFRHPQDVDCPACSACAGDPCVTPKGKGRANHEKRVTHFEGMPRLYIQGGRFTCHGSGFGSWEGYAQPHEQAVIIARAMFAAFIVATHPERRTEP